MVFVMMGGNALGAHLQLPAEPTRPRRAGELPPCALNASPQRPNSAPTAPPFAYVKRAPLRPLRAPRRFRNPRIGQQLGAQPTPGFRVILLAVIDAMIHAVIDAVIDAVAFLKNVSDPSDFFAQPFSRPFMHWSSSLVIRL